MMNVYVHQTQGFITELLHLYKSIHQLLKKITYFRNQKYQSLDSIDQNVVGCNCLDRPIRRQNQLRLFRQTLISIRQFINKKSKSKKSDLTIKYSAVSQVLYNRLNELLKVPQSSKVKILNQIKQAKQLFLKWSQGKKKQYISNKPKNSKQTNDYVLKFAYTQATRSTVGQASSYISPAKTPNNPNQLSYFERKTQKKKANTNTSNLMKSSCTSGFISPSSQKELVGSRYSKSRKTVDFKKTTLRSGSSSRLQSAKRTVITSFVPPTSKQISESSESTLRNQEQTQNSRFQRNKKNMTIEQHIQFSQEDSFTNVDSTDRKNVQFYISNNHIRSKKTIDNASIIAQKIKKRSVNIEVDLELTEKEQPSNESSYQDFLIQPSNQYRSNKYFTRKFIPSEKETQNPTWSQKTIKNGTTINLNQIAQKQKIKRLPRKGQVQRTSIKNSSLQRVDSFHSKRGSNIPEKNNISLFRDPDIVLDGQNEQKIDDQKIEPQQTFKNLYNQLGEIRKNINRQSSPYFTDFSVFFYQQKKISDEQNKKFQKILGQRKKRQENQQFNINCQITRKPSIIVEDFRQESYLNTIKANMIKCQGIEQSGPVLYDI